MPSGSAFMLSAWDRSPGAIWDLWAAADDARLLFGWSIHAAHRGTRDAWHCGALALMASSRRLSPCRIHLVRARRDPIRVGVTASPKPRRRLRCGDYLLASNSSDGARVRVPALVSIACVIVFAFVRRTSGAAPSPEVRRGARAGRSPAASRDDRAAISSSCVQFHDNDGQCSRTFTGRRDPAGSARSPAVLVVASFAQVAMDA